jgi:lactose/L-arabinose transport system permease protein
MVLFCLFMLYPIMSSLYYVTRKWKGMTNTFIGLGNFVRMANDKIFQAAIGHNFIFMLIQVPVMIFLALLLAVLLNLSAEHHVARRRLGALPGPPPDERLPEQRDA